MNVEEEVVVVEEKVEEEVQGELLEDGNLPPPAAPAAPAAPALLLPPSDAELPASSPSAAIALDLRGEGGFK